MKVSVLCFAAAVAVVAPLPGAIAGTNDEAESGIPVVGTPRPGSESGVARTRARSEATQRVLRRSDFKYRGAFRMPTEACGWPTAYASSGLAIRRVNGRLRFFSGTHVYSGGLIYEAGFPGVSKDVGDWPQASVIGEPCDVYEGRKRLGNDSEPLDGENWTHGLFFDKRTQRLYWSFGHVYNADASNDNVFGYSDYSGAKVRARGPWRTRSASGTHAQRVRGGTLAIPNRFAERYLGGRNLGIGFGGYYSIIGEGSMGPTLCAIKAPTGSSGVFDPMPLLLHPADFSRSDDWAVRPTNYWIDPNLTWGRSPSGGRGYWAPGDSIEGAAVWINGPGRRGLVYFAELNTGRIAYEDGGIQTGGYRSYWYVYAPRDLADVARDRMDPWDVRPVQVAKVSYPATGEAQEANSGAVRRITGAAYDRRTRTLFVLQLNGYQGDWDQYPLVHAFRLRAR